jgi:hypothetical protein
MDNLLALIEGEQPAGLYRLTQEITVAALSALCRDRDWQLFHIDGKTVTNKAEFLQASAKAMNFPDYFGENWDAFEDCLIDLDWCPARKYILLYTQPENFAMNSPIQWATARDILAAAVDYWQTTDTPLYVFFKTDSSLPNIPLLS